MLFERPGWYASRSAEDRPPKASSSSLQFWNAIPPWGKNQVVEIALEHPEKSPRELSDQIDLFVDHYNNDRYHKALNDITPADIYYGRGREILPWRERIKKKTMVQRRRYNYSLRLA